MGSNGYPWPPGYAGMAWEDWAPSIASAHCDLCPAVDDLVPHGEGFRCRLWHHYVALPRLREPGEVPFGEALPIP